MAKAEKEVAEKPNTSMDDAINSLRDALVSEWDAKELALDRRIPNADVASGLNRLIEKGLLSAAVATMGPSGVIVADLAIKLFQAKVGLLDDGVLGSKTFRALSDVGVDQDVHDDASDAPKISSPNSQPFNPKSPLLFYFVEDDLRTAIIGGTKANKLIVRSVVSWIEDVNLFLLRTSKREEANFIIKWEVLPGNVTGRAHIGGPRFVGQQLLLRIDKDRSWDEAKFLNTFGHELGHILGLARLRSRSNSDHVRGPKPVRCGAGCK